MLAELRAAAGAALVDITTTEVADDWSERWRSFHKPVTIGEHLHVRAPWARAPAARVASLTSVCNPVGQVRGNIVNGVRRPPAHLSCYAIHDSTRLPRRVIVRNEYEATRLSAVRTRTLCLASVVGPVPA